MEYLKVELIASKQQCWVRGDVQGKKFVAPAPLKIVGKPQFHMSLERICIFPVLSTKVLVIWISGSQ